MKTKAETDQKQRFMDAAREAGCDETPEAFERLFAKVVPPKPRPNPKPKTKKSGH